MNKMSELMDLAVERGPAVLAVAGAAEIDILKAVENVRTRGIAEAILVADHKKLKKLANEHDISLDNYEILDEADKKKQPMRAVSLIRDGKANVLVKGLVTSSDLLRAVLDKENGLGKRGLLSHVSVFEVPVYHKLLLITDAAVNIAPELGDKVELIKNAVLCANALDIKEPKVAILGAVEKVNPGKMPATEHAAMLSVMNRRGQISGCVVDGPFALDNAVSKHSAKIKGIDSPVAGDADVLVCDDIESANILYKSLLYLGDSTGAAIVLGASAPVVLTSRADNDATKAASIALATLISHII